MPAVPRTLTGKKLEVPVKRILSGIPMQEALAVASVADPASLEPYEVLARERVGGQGTAAPSDTSALSGTDGPTDHQTQTEGRR